MNSPVSPQKLCPRCKKRPRSVAKSQRLEPYCSECRREYQNMRNRLQKVINDEYNYSNDNY